MAKFKDQLQNIRRLREQMAQCDEKAYHSKLAFKKTDILLRKLRIKETRSENKKGIDELRLQIAQTAAKSQAMNVQLNEKESALEK